MWLPQNAIIAVTYRCNGRCLTCDIWKKKNKKELPSHFYSRLPSSLKDINLTGGEPFLRNDLPDIVRVIKKTCPKAKIIINTNGLLPQIITKASEKIIDAAPNTAIRVSLDGWEDTHDKIRGIKGSFQKAMVTLQKLKKIPVKDLGISFTLIETNKNQLLKLYEFAQKNKLQFSITTATSSEIYFGKNKEKLRPKVNNILKDNFSLLEKGYYQSFWPKDWFRGWFASSLREYLITGKRPFVCDADKNFFYLDPEGNIFPCHIKNWLLGNLQKQTFTQIWQDTKRKNYQNLVNSCHDCWMVCTAKTSIKTNFIKVLPRVIINKTKFPNHHAA